MYTTGQFRRKRVPAMRAIVARVADGVYIRDAAIAVGFHPKTVDKWQRRYPGFRRLLDEAIAAHERNDPRKAAYLDALRSGKAAGEAQRAAGLKSGAVPARWRKTDRAFAKAERDIKGRFRTVGSEDRFIDTLAHILDGLGTNEAFRRTGLSPSQLTWWKNKRPDLYHRYVAVKRVMADPGVCARRDIPTGARQ